MKRKLLLFFTIFLCGLLMGCRNAQIEDMNSHSKNAEIILAPTGNGNESSTVLTKEPVDKDLTEGSSSTEITVQDWEEIEWQNVKLLLPASTSKTYTQDTFQSADQTVQNENREELAGLELIISTWRAEWSGGNYEIEYFEITTDPEMERLKMRSRGYPLP